MEKKQKVIRYLGKEVDGKPVKRVKRSSIKIIASKKHLDIEIINHIAISINFSIFSFIAFLNNLSMSMFSISDMFISVFPILSYLRTQKRYTSLFFND